MTQSQETFQIPLEAAEIYEARFIPALFGEWAPLLVEAAGVAPGHTVLDIACGTGVVARTAADRMDGRGKLVGVDLNPAMLTVARRLRPDIEWRQADAAALPFANDSFDIVLCQSALMFFPDRTQALREMARVITASGTVAVQVWGSLASQPAYGPFVDVAARHAGPAAVNLLSAYWALGDLDALRMLFEAAGLQVTATQTHVGTARFESVDAFVATEVESTPLIERISNETYHRIREESRAILARFCTANGRVEAPIEGHLITARRR
jgi:ubiquinone/menaquinone biosynthesis C-methylase UbiE